MPSPDSVHQQLTTGEASSASPTRLRKPAVGAFLAVALSLAVAGCPDKSASGLRCPILAPGALAGLQQGASLTAFGAPDAAQGTLTAGLVAVHPIYVPMGTKLTATIRVTGHKGLLMLYGPRNDYGGFGACRALKLAENEGNGVAITLDAGEELHGEYLVAVSTPPGPLEPGPNPAQYTINVTCKEGCEPVPPRCPTLADLGCGNVRCDGELVRDGQGCQTCQCDPSALCGPNRSAGPSGACTRPACHCPVIDEPVCGADGKTWRSRCHSLCAGVPVIAEGRCEDLCPGLSSCSSSCFGPRSLDSNGCPTCGCAGDEPQSLNDCAACPLVPEPVCGSDGVTYPSRCHARCAGARVLYPTACVETCRTPPEGCDADCEWGYMLSGNEQDCLLCTCANAPPLSCNTGGEPICVDLPLLSTTSRVTVGSICLAVHLGATAAEWGPCGVACDLDEDCPDGTRCATAGLFDGRCRVIDEPACGCSSIWQPVCAADGLTHANTCLARCAGLDVVHLGACCDAAPSCGAPQVPAIDHRGCPVEPCADPPAEAPCLTEEPLTPACDAQGTDQGSSVCAAHVGGQEAAWGWCP